METGNVWIWIVGQFVVAAAIWGGIRSDLRNIHERMAKAESAIDRAHERIDNMRDGNNTGSHQAYRPK